LPNSTGQPQLAVLQRLRRSSEAPRIVAPSLPAAACSPSVPEPGYHAFEDRREPSQARHRVTVRAADEPRGAFSMMPIRKWLARR